MAGQREGGGPRRDNQDYITVLYRKLHLGRCMRPESAQESKVEGASDLQAREMSSESRTPRMSSVWPLPSPPAPAPVPPPAPATAEAAPAGAFAGLLVNLRSTTGSCRRPRAVMRPCASLRLLLGNVTSSRPRAPRAGAPLSPSLPTGVQMEMAGSCATCGTPEAHQGEPHTRFGPTELRNLGPCPHPPSLHKGEHANAYVILPGTDTLQRTSAQKAGREGAAGRQRRTSVASTSSAAIARG